MDREPSCTLVSCTLDPRALFDGGSSDEMEERGVIASADRLGPGSKWPLLLGDAHQLVSVCLSLSVHGRPPFPAGVKEYRHKASNGGAKYSLSSLTPSLRTDKADFLPSKYTTAAD